MVRPKLHYQYGVLLTAMLFHSLPDLAPDTIQNVYLLAVPPVLYPQQLSPRDPGSPAPSSESAADASDSMVPLLFTDIPYLMARTPVHKWYTLVVSPLAKGAQREHWLKEFAPYGCLGGDVRGLDEFQVKDVYTEMVSYIWLFEPQYIEQAIAHHHSQSDLHEMMKRGNQTLLPPLAKERIHPMDIVSFDKAWLFDKLASIAISDIPPYLHCLEMVMHGHLEPPPQSQVKEFAVYMWPTNGPYDKLIRLITKWVMEDGGPSYWNLIWMGLVIYMDSHYVIPEFSIVAKGVIVTEPALVANSSSVNSGQKSLKRKKAAVTSAGEECSKMADKPEIHTSKHQWKPTEKARTSVAATTTVGVGPKSSTTACLTSRHFSTPEMNPPTHTTPANTLPASLSMLNTNARSNLAVPSAPIRTNGDGSDGDGDKGNSDKGNSDKGNSDKGNSDKGNSDKGDGDKGNSDKGNSDKGNSDKGDGDKGNSDKGNGDKGDGDKGDGDEGDGDEVGSDDEDGGHSPDSVQFHEFQPSTSSQWPQKGKPDYPSADMSNHLGIFFEFTKRNQNHTHSLNGDKSPIPDMSPQSPQFGTLSLLKFAAARDNSMPHPSSNILSLSDEDSDEIIHHLPDTFGSHGVLRQNWSPLSGVSIHEVEELPMVANSKKHGLVLNTATHIANAAPDDVNNCLDPDFWPNNPSISSSLPFFDGPVPEAVILRAWLLRDRFLEDLGALAEKSRYPQLKLLMVTEVKLVNHAVVDKEKGQREKNAFNRWSRSYMKEAPNPLQGEVGHCKQSDYMREVITPAWYAFKREHEAIGDLDEQLSRLQAEMVTVEIDNLKQASQGAGLSHLMAVEQDGMAKTIAMAGAHTIILMVSGRPQDDKSAARNGVFYGSNVARWFWTSINPLGNIIWQFYIFINNETIRLQQVELNPELAQASAWHAELTDISKAKAASSKHLRALFEPFVSLEERFPWQSLADLLYGHQLEIINWGVAPGFANLDCNASNSVLSWHLLCSEFHKAPSNIIIGQASVPIMTDHNGKVLMWVRSSQRYLEDVEDVQDPAIAGARKGKHPILGKPEGRSKKRSRAAVAAATPIAAHSTASVDVPLVTGDTETEATAAISTCNVTAPGLLITSGIEANPAAANTLLTTRNDVVAPAPSHMLTSPDINGSSSPPSGSFNPFVAAESSTAPTSAPHLHQPYGYGNPMLPYQGMQHPNPLGLSSFEGQRLNPNSYGSSQQNVDLHDFLAASQAGPDIWRLPTGPNFPP
ncbi:hypothetical protein BS47DRAFT_1361394 [Hydnum rufescens UP504]|uniref:Uncharacterized protein n=1 Tax=Hydnum rufescens UP504 TaxID=1448309 RepID=A0A9P6AZE6_9AGAM|nr:hypothetical protein BS47DRAFT_1361394 [Hydnum rufescens UP504]